MVCVTVTVGVVGAGVVGAALVVAVVGEALVGEGDGDGEGDTVGLGDAAAAVSGWQDWLTACAATVVATAAVALPAKTAKMPQETEASKTPVAERVTAVRRVRVKRISTSLPLLIGSVVKRICP